MAPGAGRSPQLSLFVEVPVKEAPLADPSARGQAFPLEASVLLDKLAKLSMDDISPRKAWTTLDALVGEAKNVNKTVNRKVTKGGAKVRA